MFRNLNAELARKSISNAKAAEKLNISVKTMSNKLNGITEFNLREMKEMTALLGIRDLNYLFATEEQTA